MVRIFHVYYPLRTLVLFAGEALALLLSFFAAVLLEYGRDDSMIVLQYEMGVIKLVILTAATLLLAHYLDLYSPRELVSRQETYIRLYTVLGVLSIGIALLSYFFPEVAIGKNVYLYGTVIATLVLSGWRTLFNWSLTKPIMLERVYVLGDGDRARRLVNTLRSRTDLGMEVIGWSGALGGNGSLTREELAEGLRSLHRKNSFDTVIVALADRRGTIPSEELLELKLQGIHIEEATTLLEKTSGCIDLEHLHPSWMIFSDGFRLSSTALLIRRITSFLIALGMLTLVAPILPILALLVKLTSPGPILYRQRRVGKNGKIFKCLKFRSMRQDAESGTGAVWADKNDPRITSVGRLLRKTRLDELPQLWNVLRGDMAFIGPRPERPEFVESLAAQIRYYNLRHVIRPGITGWAQVSYPYGSTVEDARQKLQYDLFYVKNMSVALDLFILFQTVKTVLLRRGAQ